MSDSDNNKTIVLGGAAAAPASPPPAPQRSSGSDVALPPGTRLEKLTGSRAGQHSIRVNDQFRICFTWTAGGPTDVEIVDYH